MDYQQPYGTSPGSAYVNGNPATGTAGSIPPAAAFEHPQRELINWITDNGLTPAGANLHQLSQGLQASAAVYAVDTGSANAISVALNPVPSGYTTGMTFRVKVAAGNTGAVTVNANALGVKSVVLPGGNPVPSGAYKTGAVLQLTYDGTSFQLTGGLGGGGAGSGSVAILAHTESSGVDGGTFPTNEAWFTRKLNTVQQDPDGIVTSLISNQFTLPAGSYRITSLRMSAYGINRMMTRLYNVTTAAVLAYGDNGNATPFSSTSIVTRDDSMFIKDVALAVPTTFRVEMICMEGSVRSYSLGKASGYGPVEVYALLQIQKL